MCCALIDTGSEVCLAQKKLIETLGLHCNQMRNIPQLTGVTQHILSVLGTVYLDVHIGSRVVTPLFSVVPDGYLDTDLLLGADLIRSAPMTWDDAHKIIIWDRFIYPVRYLKPRPSNKRVRQVKVLQPNEPHKAHVRLEKKLILPQYTAGIYPLPVDEPPNTLLEFVPEIKECQTQSALCLKVNDAHEVFLPLVNNTKARMTVKVGTLLGYYRTISEGDIDQPVPNCRKTRIQNDLVPPGVDVNINSGNTREENLKYLFSQKDNSHLTTDQQTELSDMLVANHSVFILEEKELGKFKDVQAHIAVSDPQPVRSPIYRYPEKAKTLISTMLEDMEERGIIEASSAAWLSPIVLVRKPDHTQRMCLDYVESTHTSRLTFTLYLD
ncbi:uncharacterized protein [Macrobrachium rosenbergii]|uniref:uncharacterized protein n=1 Tax=Macrobrachium rosenbergii TaxID=79674 RepID=UPI0034D3D474